MQPSRAEDEKARSRGIRLVFADSIEPIIEPIAAAGSCAPGANSLLWETLTGDVRFANGPQAPLD